MFEAWTEAQIRLALGAGVASAYAVGRLLAAHCAVSLHVHAYSEVLAGQRVSRVGTCAPSLWPLLRRQLIHEWEHELLAEAELPRRCCAGQAGWRAEESWEGAGAVLTGCGERALRRRGQVTVQPCAGRRCEGREGRRLQEPI